MSTELNKRIVTSLILISTLVGMYLSKFILLLALTLFSLFVWLEFTSLISKIITKKQIKNLSIKFSLQLVAFIYIIFFSYIFWYCFSNQNIKSFFLLILGICIVTDIGGLVFGRYFKGRKLTKISPKKTISGVIGSYVFSLFLALFFYSFILKDISLFILAIITLLVSTVSQIGDLTISYIKRKANVKDTGKLLPGHGGFLDRFDGIIFGVPFGFFIIFFLGLI